MTTTLHLFQNQIWIDFPFIPANYATAKALPSRTYLPDLRRWVTPLSELATVQEAFPGAAIDADLQTELDIEAKAAVRRFARSLEMFSVRIVERDGVLVVEGEGVSPVLQEEVAKRADTLRKLGLYRIGL